MKQVARIVCCLSAAFGGFLGLSSASAAEMAAQYRPVEWVELRGGAVFDTERMTEATDEIRFKFAMMAKGSSSQESAFGDFESSKAVTRVRYCTNSQTDFYVSFMSGGSTQLQKVTTLGEPVEGYLNASHVKLNAKEADLTQTTADPTTKTMALTSTAKVSVRYWYFRIVNKETGATVLDWTPCRDVETGEYGFWDGEKFIEGDTGDAGAIVGSPILIAVSDPAPQVFTGEAIEPAVTVTSIDVSGESHVLTEGTDYQVTYAHNVGLGTANVTVVGKAGSVFEGSIATTTFEITAPEPGDVALGGAYARLRRQMLKDGATFSTAGITVVDAQGKALDPSTYTIHTANTEGTDIATVWATVTSGSYAGQMAIGKVAVVSIEDGFEPTPTDYPYIDGSAYEMPEGYVRLGYIEGPGHYGAIGTGVTLVFDHSSVEAVVEFPDPSADYAIWTAHDKNDAYGLSAEYIAGQGFHFLLGDGQNVSREATIETEIRAGARYRVTIGSYAKDGTRGHYAQVECDDRVVGRVSFPDAASNYGAKEAFSLFRYRHADAYSYSTCRILSFRAWNEYWSGTKGLNLDYVPALRLSDGAIGYYNFGKNPANTFVAANKYFSESFGRTKCWAPVPELTLAVDPIDYVGRADGSAHTPPVVVRNKATGAVLTANDYTIAYYNNVNAGMASVVVTGQGAYAGQVGCERFRVQQVYLVTADGTAEGDGQTWETAMTLEAAVTAAIAFADDCEVWVSGSVPGMTTVREYTGTVPMTLAVRGGFAGTERAIGERIAGARSVVDGGGTNAYCLAVKCGTSSVGTATTVESLEIKGATAHGFFRDVSGWRTAGNLTVSNCVFSGCPNGARLVGRYTNNYTGTDPNAALVLRDCVFKDCNVTGDYGALYTSGFGEAIVENCRFLNNKSTSNRNNAYGVALYVKGMSVEVVNCEFRGNVAADQKGEIAYLNGICGGSIFRHCTFVGNTLSSAGSKVSTLGGCVVAELNAVESDVAVENCTFAYNLVKKGTVLNAAKGTIRIANSIVWGNPSIDTAGATAHGAEVFCSTANGIVAATNCLFSAKGVENLSGAGLRIAEGLCVFSDPQFVTSTETFRELTGCEGFPVGDGVYEDPNTFDFDLHLLSGAGYRKNGDTTWYLSVGVQSPAIDAGDPDASVGDEPDPNGGILNLGVYGGTASASKTMEAHPDIAGEITVTWPGEWSQPVVHFTTGGEGAYSASVAIQISTDGGATWVYAPDPLTGITNGQTVDHLVTTCFPPEGKLTVKVTISAAGSDASKQADGIDVEGTLPPCWGKGGGAGVVHVRPDATGKGDGTSWWDAVTTLEEGLALLAPERPELWWAARTNELAEGYVTYQFAIPVKIRGGFAGTESAASQRLPGARSVIDGHGEVGPCFQFSNTASVTLDAIEFVRSSERGLYRAASTGDLLITNCAFRCCGYPNYTGEGVGFNVAGAGNRVSSVRVVDSQIEGNVAYSVNAQAKTKGIGMRVDNLKVFELVNCTVRTNAYRSSASNSGVFGLMATDTPATIEGCAFRGNKGASGTVRPASVIRLEGACGGSAIRNSVFAGNLLNPNGGEKAGVVDVQSTSSTNDVYEIDNCTFAYNYVGQMAAVTVPACVLKVKNSIFHANVGATGVSGNPSIGGVDIASSKTNAVLEVSYSMFDGEGTNYVSAVTEEPVEVSNCIYGDPLFVTTTEAFAELAGVDLTKLPRAEKNYTHPSDEVACSYDVHETHRSPAVDAGDPASDYRREPSPNGRRVNLGAYGNTSEAALSKAGLVLFVQ